MILNDPNWEDNDDNDNVANLITAIPFLAADPNFDPSTTVDITFRVSAEVAV
ncbi:MAG: hypothetical protein R2766_02720 [Saprospiraceae bacterium]